jgi:hypothetical protein
VATTTSPAPAVSNTIAGKVLHKETRQGLGDVLVELFDLDEWGDPEGIDSPRTARDATTIANDPMSLIEGGVASLYKRAKRVGSASTRPSGEFVIQLTAKDFNLSRKPEQKPDLILLLLAPDEPGLDLNKRLLHFSRDIRFNASSSEAHVILLPSALLKEKGVPFGAQEPPTPPSVRGKVDAYVADKEYEKRFDAGAADYHARIATKDSEARQLFRKEFVGRLSTDLRVAGLRGAVVVEGDNIRQVSLDTVSSGVADVNQVLDDPDTQGIPVNLYLTTDDQNRLDPFLGNTAAEFVDIPETDVGDILFRANSSENPGTLLIHNNPIAAACAAESFEEKCAKLHTDLSHDHHPTPPPGTAPVVLGAITDGDILTYVDRLVRDVPTPDVVLRPELAKTRSPGDVETSVNAFSLQKGPAEVPAFFDFHYVQIAFEHVWKQMFDETLPNLAYTANTMAKARLGVDDLVGGVLNNGLLSADLFYVVPSVDVPAIIARFFDVTREEYNEMSITNREELKRIANQINECSISSIVDVSHLALVHEGPTLTDRRIIQSLTEQGERLIDAVRHDDYHTLHKTLRDLHARLSGSYEFTVFAADKNHHSVNFGLMNTYRQEWTPLMYQAGELIDTIPLSPKEERKYSTRVNRQEKRSVKEAKRNNSSVTNERSSTSRVEADIMAKMQNKTNFGMTAEGDFDIGIYKGKGTTSFGVEAITESTQNRKDLRELAQKVVQEYKNEVSLELTTDTDFTTETTESGTISNPNDELAVTYLFYELQKRYRISEKIHRIMPVVMVAQEVPSPDQITPAWVIAHDWIINRYILDDGFRATLGYLANNSVGDDFALRELRKNLRQQRNLVETLRIEFSAASAQADNRYRALEAQIRRRIKAEEDEATDGLLSDITDFFGRGPVLGAIFGDGNQTDPEAAKARELAAKDAHQYAMEKAERAGAALKEEISTLHLLTEQYNKTLQARLDNETKVKRLLVHIRDNIFYYMQAIWTLEPPDQRYLRLHKVEVPVLELESRSYRVKVAPELDDIFARFREPGTRKHRAFLHGRLKHNAAPNPPFRSKPLVEVADLGTFIGFIGNYMLFPMKEHNALTEFMAAPFIDSAFGAMDPDELSNVSLEEYAKYVCCLHDSLDEAGFEAIKQELVGWLKKLLATQVRNGDEIVVPTGSLFIEALVDPNPVLEQFKLEHRELDVYKVQAEVRRAELENIRLAARLLHDEREDPDIERKILIEGGGTLVLPQPDA